jgi:CxxC motif-containing protein (DUF1111 family)
VIGRELSLHFAAVLSVAAGMLLQAQVDPGPRAGKSGAGSYYPTLNPSEQQAFSLALARFQEIDSVSGTVAGEAGSGLGPAFNGDSCAMCHAQPTMGGSSPGLTSPQKPVPNPQVAVATLHGAKNTMPAFITASGPVREARFVSDGGVHDLFTIAGRSDATGCTLAQPDFANELAAHNVIFRIPTPLFGLGLVENTPDAVLQASLAANQQQKAAMGITGRFNTSGNDGTVTRFGWKAQNKSLLIFAGEAYNVEQGVSNEAFPNDRSAVAGCVFNATPEDFTLTDPTAGPRQLSDVVNFAMFARLLAPPVAVTSSASELRGQSLFTNVGCAMCHTPSLTTAQSIFTGMSNVTYQPFSDFALHRMGATLADGVVQGSASGDEFRTAPLWGLGQRLFFLHDGRTSNLLDAIQAHSTPNSACSPPPPGGRPPAPPGNCTSEANQVIAQFNAFSTSDQQDILNFLRSL